MAYQVIQARQRTDDFFFEVCPNAPCSGDDDDLHRTYTYGRSGSSMTVAAILAEIDLLEAARTATREVGLLLAAEGTTRG